MPTDFDRGRDLLERLNPGATARLADALDDLAPGLSATAIGFGFGSIYDRPGLDIRTRQLLSIASLTTLGTAPGQLRNHIRAAMNAGCTREEIVEAIVHVAIYAGLPASFNGIAAAREVFEGGDQAHSGGG